MNSQITNNEKPYEVSNSEIQTFKIQGLSS